MRVFSVLLAMLVAVPAAAQIQSRPTDPPLVTAVNESWYRLREPVQFAGDLYYPAGAARFFNGSHMVRTGHYNGVPLYTDTTIEPFSVILVPMSRGLMQPYERRRQGDLAGTSGSRTSSFPNQLTPAAISSPAAPAPPTAPPMVTGAVSVFTPATADRDATPRTVGTAGVAAAPLDNPSPMVTLLRPESNDGVWIRYAGGKWVSAGAAVPFDHTFVHVGEHGTFPVFARAGTGDMIYLPTSRAGVVAPYRLEE